MPRKYKQYTQGKWNIEIDVEWTPQSTYKHEIIIHFNKKLLSRMSLWTKKKKLDSYMWFETVKLAQGKMTSSEWEDIIKELAGE